MARDWRFAPASFRGATFYVDSGSPSGGRRKAIHEYPGAETWDVEDLGTKAKKVTLTAYVASETADTDYATLIAACDQTGPAQLILPFFGVVTASAETWEPRWSQEKLNYVGGDFAFVIENPANAPVPLGLGERLIAAALAAAPATIGTAISTLFAGIPATSYQRSDASAYLQDATALVTTILQATSLPDATATTAIATLAALTPTASTASEIDPGAFLAIALGVLDAIAIDAAPDDAAPTFQTAAALAATMIPAGVIGQQDPSQAAASVPVALAIATAMQAMRLIATSTYTDRQTAMTARTELRAIAIAVLPTLGALGADASAAFTDLWGQAVTYLSAVILNLAPILLYQTNLSLPSTVLAYRLYADPTRAAELVARNRVTTALFMPTIFEAAAP